MRPSGLVNGSYCDLPALGVSHVIGRWRPGVGARPQPQAVPVASMAIVMPGVASSGLAWAAAEAEQLQQMFPFARAVNPVKRRQIDALLNSGDAQIVHFSGHGTPGANADLTALELEGGERIVAMAFASSRLGQTRQPLRT